MDAAATRTQTLFVQIDHRLKKVIGHFLPPALTFTCSFLRALIFSSCSSASRLVHLPFITAASTFQLIPLTAPVFLLAGAGVSLPPTLRHAVKQQPRRPTRRKPQRLVAPATRYYQRTHACRASVPGRRTCDPQ